MTEKNVNAAENTAGEVSTPAVQETAKAPAVVAAGSNYIVQVLETSRKEFIEVNAGMDLDYVRAGEWLKLNKKGNYVESADENVSYKDSIDVVVAQGEQRYMLWGKDGSPEKGTLIVAERTLDEAKQVLGGWLVENPQAAERYAEGDIQLRYLCYLVPVITLDPEDTPLIYLFDLPQGDTIGWGKFAKAVFDGKFKALGIPKKTPINRVVVRFTSEERKKDNDSWLGTKFEPVGLFNPADYGIDPNAQA